MQRTTVFLASALTACAALAACTAIETKADQQMKTMQDMHHKMMAAKPPEDRQALMADHMKAMHGGMTNRCTAMRDMTMQMMKDREGPQR